MKLRRVLNEIAKAVGDEAERNPEFHLKLLAILRPEAPSPASAPTQRRGHEDPKRASNRRPAPVLDPLSIGSEGEMVLRERLSTLGIEQLRDIVADYAMDPSKLVMKWKDREKVVDRIVEISMARLKKGDAFRE